MRGATRAEGSSKQTVGETAGPAMRRLTGADHTVLLLLDQCYRVMQPNRFTGHYRITNSSPWGYFLINPSLELPSATENVRGFGLQ